MERESARTLAAAATRKSAETRRHGLEAISHQSARGAVRCAEVSGIPVVLAVLERDSGSMDGASDRHGALVRGPAAAAQRRGERRNLCVERRTAELGHAHGR